MKDFFSQRMNGTCGNAMATLTLPLIEWVVVFTEMTRILDRKWFGPKVQRKYAKRVLIKKNYQALCASISHRCYDRCKDLKNEGDKNENCHNRNATIGYPKHQDN